GIRDFHVTGVQTCALPIFARRVDPNAQPPWPDVSDAALLESLESWLLPWLEGMTRREHLAKLDLHAALLALLDWNQQQRLEHVEIGRASRRGRVQLAGDAD